MVFLDQIGTAGRELAAPPVARLPGQTEPAADGAADLAVAEAEAGFASVFAAGLEEDSLPEPDLPTLPEQVAEEPEGLVLTDAEAEADATAVNEDPATMAAELIAAVMGSEAAAKSMEATAHRVPTALEDTNRSPASLQASLEQPLPPQDAGEQDMPDTALDPGAEHAAEKSLSQGTANPASKGEAMMAQLAGSAETLRPALEPGVQQTAQPVAVAGPAGASQPATASAQAPLAPPPPPIVNTAQVAWVEQVVDRIKTGASDGVDEIEMLLSPRNLGKVAIRIDMKEGVATVAIVTETPEAARLFNDTQARLSDLMGEAGLNLAGHDAGTGTRDPGTGTLQAAGGPSEPEHEDIFQPATAPVGPAHAGLVDYLA